MKLPDLFPRKPSADYYTFWVVVSAGSLGWNIHTEDYGWAGFVAVLALYFLVMLNKTPEGN